jgi:hypothetical protein
MRIQYRNTTNTATRTLASHPHVSVTRAPRVGGGQSTSVTESYKVHTRTLARMPTNLSLWRCRTANGELRICADGTFAIELVAAIFPATSCRLTDIVHAPRRFLRRPEKRQA